MRALAQAKRAVAAVFQGDQLVVEPLTQERAHLRILSSVGDPGELVAREAEQSSEFVAELRSGIDEGQCRQRPDRRSDTAQKPHGVTKLIQLGIAKDQARQTLTRLGQHRSRKDVARLFPMLEILAISPWYDVVHGYAAS